MWTIERTQTSTKERFCENSYGYTLLTIFEKKLHRRMLDLVLCELNPKFNSFWNFKKRKLMERLCFNYLVSCRNTRACTQVNYHESILSFLQNLLSQNISNKKSMTTQAFVRMNVAPDLMTFLSPVEKCPMDFSQGDNFTAEIW